MKDEVETKMGRKKNEIVGNREIGEYDAIIGFYEEGDKTSAMGFTKYPRLGLLGFPFLNQQPDYKELLLNEILPYVGSLHAKTCLILPIQPSNECEPASVEDLKFINRRLSAEGLEVSILGGESY